MSVTVALRAEMIALLKELKMPTVGVQYMILRQQWSGRDRRRFKDSRVELDPSQSRRHVSAGRQRYPNRDNIARSSGSATERDGLAWRCLTHAD